MTNGKQKKYHYQSGVFSDGFAEHYFVGETSLYIEIDDVISFVNSHLEIHCKDPSFDKDEKYSVDWYAWEINRCLERLEEFEDWLEITPSDHTDIIRFFLKISRDLGVLCSEFRLAQKHRKAALQANREMDARREGGRSRARPDREAIIEAMQRRIDAGQTLSQAARNTFEVDGLGANGRANQSVYHRWQKNVSLLASKQV